MTKEEEAQIVAEAKKYEEHYEDQFRQYCADGIITMNEDSQTQTIMVNGKFVTMLFKADGEFKNRMARRAITATIESLRG